MPGDTSTLGARDSHAAGSSKDRTSDAVPILMYHSIDDTGPIELAPYRVSPAAFESQLGYLAEQGYHGISLEDWAGAIGAGRPVVGRPVIITFDDGYQNFLRNAWPVLERTGFTATMFVVTDKVGQTADWDRVSGEPLRLMDWDDLRYLQGCGLTVGSHTASHRSLPTLSTNDILTEGTRARARLRDELGIDATSMAYPYGHTDDRVCETIGQAGYTTAVGTWGGISTLAHNPLNLPRIEIFPDDDIGRFAAKVSSVRARPAASTPGQRALREPRVVPHSRHDTGGKDMPAGRHIAQGPNPGLPTLQTKLSQLFRQPITGTLTRQIGRGASLTRDVSVHFENGARVALNVTPKSDHALSPENCLNTLEFGITGPSRWWSLQVEFEWADVSSALRFQVGIYTAVDRRVSGRTAIRLPKRDGKSSDVVLSAFELDPERHNFNKSGELPSIEFIDLNTEQRPKLLLDLNTGEIPELSFTLNYFSVYFD